MSYEVAVTTDRRAKVRNPWAVLGLSVLTWIYMLWWWGAINRELRRVGFSHGDDELAESNPSHSVWAMGLGFFLAFVPTVWTIVTTAQRVQRAQRSVGMQDSLNGWLYGALWVFTLGLGAPVYLQYEINRIWESGAFPRWEVPALVVAASAPSLAGQPDLDRLERLASLWKSGAISDEEYEAQKAGILSAD
jgi:hypothetical protein